MGLRKKIKTWQKRAMDIAKSLDFEEKMAAGSLTADEQKQLFAKYEEVHGVTFSADKEANVDEPEADQTILSEDDQKSLAAVFGENAPKTATEVVAKVVEQDTTIKTLEGEPEVKTPVASVGLNGSATIAKTMAITLGHSAHTPTHLYGIEDPLFIRGRWYNELSVNRKPVAESITIEQRREFKEAFNSFAEKLVSRSTELHSSNMIETLDYKKMIAGESTIDYSDLFGKAGEYIVRRTDLILAYLRTLPSVSHIFPLVSNIQNKEIAPGANFGELSQGYREGKIFKGSVHFTAEIYSVIDVMFKFLFKDLIKLEKQYIGYLNRQGNEGSNVIKWTFVEWIMIHFGTILRNEQNRRRVIGVRVPQQNVVSNPAMLAADGAYRAIERVEEELKIRPNPEFEAYSETTIVEYYEGFWDWVSQILDSMEGYKMYANLKHRPWYIRNFRKKYGKDTDFTGVASSELNDVDANIIWVPNLPLNVFKLIITVPGNIENYEDKPNEMLAFYFERDWEQLGVMSRWKEGSGVQQAGIQYKTPAELEASNYENQWIFTNDPATSLADGDTEPDGKVNTLFKTGENTAVTAITDIKNADISRVYKIVCGDLTNATTIAKAGKFAKLSAAWNPAKVGDYIKVHAELEDYTDTIDGETVTLTRPTGNFLELERKAY